jgi:hypothetical protein
MKPILRTFVITTVFIFLAMLSAARAGSPPAFLEAGKTYVIFYQADQFKVKIIKLVDENWAKVEYIEGNQNRTGWVNLSQVREIDAAN